MPDKCIIASVPRFRLEQIRVPADVARVASRVGYAAHAIAEHRAELRDSIDGGAPLDTDTWHPLRGFMFHEPASVKELATRLAAFAAEMREYWHPLQGDSWAQGEVTKVVELFHHASMAGESVVTFLDGTRTGKRV